MHPLSANILSAIGETPLIRLDRLTHGLPGAIFAKLEYMAPGLSKKDRIAQEMIATAEREGLLKPGQTVVELTSGSMGTGLAIVCNLKGYPFVAVMSRGNSMERAQMMKAFGAEVVLVDQCPDSVPGKVTGRDLELVEERTQQITRERGAFRINQFHNVASVATGHDRVAPEILQQLGDQKLDAFVDFMGTAGSFVGAALRLRERFPALRCYGVESANAAYYGKGMKNGGGHVIQGGSYSLALQFVDEHRDVLTGFLQVSDDEATQTARALATRECIFAGYSSGANAAAALQLLRASPTPINVLITIVDSGLKYMSTPLWEQV